MSTVLANSVYDVDNLTTVFHAVNVSNITFLDVLDGDRGVTLFAPNDTAVTTTQCNVGGLLPNVTTLATLLGNHVCLLIRVIYLV